jgi:hypothetical protein
MQPVNYAFQFSGHRDGPKGKGKGRDTAKFKTDCPPKSSHGSVTSTPNKLLLTSDISHGLARVELSSISSLPFQLDKYINFSFTPLSINY